jgi:hypothetical protein
MGHISTDPIDWRNGNSFSFFDVDVGAMFKAGALFTARGFSYSTIKALVRAGIYAPERLLFADGADLLLISGLDEQAFREIARYRRQFAGMQQAQTSGDRPRAIGSKSKICSANLPSGDFRRM